MKLIVLVLSQIVLVAGLACFASGLSDEELSAGEIELSQMMPYEEELVGTPEIEDKVAEVLDEREVLMEEPGPEIPQPEDSDAEMIRPRLLLSGVGETHKEASEVKTDAQDELATDTKGSGAHTYAGEPELIEEARDNQLTFLSLFHGKYYQSYYQMINNHLVDKLEENDNTTDNMMEAIRWLDYLESFQLKNANLIRALKQFTALTKVGGDNLCTKNAYGILRKNDLATQGRAHRRRTKLGAMRRVDKIVYEYSLQHAINCFREYPWKFAERRAQLDQLKLSYVEPLFDQIFQSVLRPKRLLGIFAHPDADKNIDPTELVRGIKSLDKAAVGEVALEKLRFFVRNDPDRQYLDLVNDDRSGKYIIRDDKVIELFDKYIVKPCEYYIEQLGFDVLIPMRFDVQMLEVEDRYLLEGDQLIEFFNGYARFRACNLLVYQDRKSVSRHLLKAVYKQSMPKN